MKRDRKEINDLILYVGNTKDPRVSRRLQVKHFCFEPVHRAHLPSQDCKVLLDSGAFADVRRGRLTFERALARQLGYEQRNDFVSERIVSYDLLVDEQLQGGRRIKSRWDEGVGWNAVRETVAEAEFIARHRRELLPRQLVLSCQGVTTEQYVQCVREVLEIALPGDCVGLGGWCIVGQRRHLAKLFWQTMDVVLPMIASKCHDVHLFGVSYVPLLRDFAVRCRDLGLNASTDTNRFYFELSRGFVFSAETGKSVRAVAKRNLALDRKLAIQNIETAYRFIANIETWQPTNQLF